MAYASQGAGCPELLCLIDGHLKQSGKSELYGLREFEAVKGAQDLVRDYGCFLWASRLAEMFSKNIPSMSEGHEEAFELFGQSLASMRPERKGLAGASFLKAAYALLKAEGYPVKEDWLMRLDAEGQAAVKGVLFRRLEELDEGIEVEGWIQLLGQWAKAEGMVLFSGV